MQTPNVFIAYEPRVVSLRCALAYLKSGDDARRHELAQMQERFAREWLLNWQDPREVSVRAERLEKFSRAHTPWTYYSPGFEHAVLKHLARHWPLGYRPGAEAARAAHKRRVATRARP